MERVLLFRPLTGELLHSEVRVKSGSDTRVLSAPGDISFTLPAFWHAMKDQHGVPVFGKRQTLVVVERANRTIRQAGLVDDLQLSGDSLEVSCGGFSMIAGQSGPWEGHQGYYVSIDPVTLFRRVWAQVQSYKNADLGIRVTGATSSGSAVGYAGSARWRQAERDVKRYTPELEKWESRVLARERILSQRQEAMFKATGLKRVGSVNVTDSEPEDPGYKADSTLWVRESNRRAYRFRSGRWVSQSQADDAVRSWLNYQPTLQRAKDEVSRLQYLIEPAKERMELYADEAREEYGLYFWQNHDMKQVIEQLTDLGPFEYREEAAWTADEQLDLMLNVGAPSVGVRREELHLELGVNVQEQPVMEHGDQFTGVAVFGAGEGSGVLSEQRDWNPAHVVRNIHVETDKDAHTKALARAAANKLMKQLRNDAGLSFSSLVVHHTDAVPEGSFGVGDQLPITGTLSDGATVTEWVRVLEISHEWGTRKSSIEVEGV